MSRASSALRGQMIFLVGARRSGTNWLQRILGSARETVTIPSETSLFSHGIKPLTERFQHAVPVSPRTGFVYVDRDAMLDGLRDFCDIVFGGVRDSITPESTRIIERTPDHVRMLGLMGDIYPDASFIHIIRDGRDVVRSLLAQPWGPSGVEEAALEWRTAIEAARAASGALERYKEVRYEELLSDPTAITTDLFTWLGLDASADTIERATREARRTFNVDATDPRVDTGKWHGTFSSPDFTTMMAVAGPILKELGYASSADDTDTTSDEVPRKQRTKKRRWKPVARRRGGATPSAERERLRLGLRVVDRFLESLHLGRFDTIRELFADDPWVSIHTPTERWEAWGTEGVSRLTRELETDACVTGRLIGSDVHPAVPTYTIMTTYSENDLQQQRAFVLSVDNDRVSRLAVYLFPPSR